MHPDSMPAKRCENELEHDPTELKSEINNLIWMHAHPKLTLDEADLRAMDILEIIRKAPSQTKEQLDSK